METRLINANKSDYIAAPKFQIMEYNRIVAVTGMPGLYEILSSKSDGAIVRSLDDKSTKFVSSRIHNLSHLESIEVYTVKENVTLTDIFSAMKNSKEKMPDVKDNKALKAYFDKVYPDLDFERVYTSDMKKMIKWYEVIEQNNIDFTKKEEPQEETTQEEATQEEPAQVEKTKTKATKKTAVEPVAAAPAADKANEETTEEKPKAKRGRKKKTEEES